MNNSIKNISAEGEPEVKTSQISFSTIKENVESSDQQAKQKAQDKRQRKNKIRLINMQKLNYRSDLISVEQ